MKFLKIGILTIIATAGIPTSTFAVATFGTLVDLANTLAGGVVTSLGYLMFTLAVVAFFWGIVQFIWAARQGDAGKGVENGKQFMLWGLIALFTMFSVWGIITFAQGVFGIKGETSIVIPNIQLLGGSSSATSQQSSGTACTGGSTLVNGVCTSVQSGTVCTGTTVYNGTSCVEQGSPCTKAVCSNGSCNGVVGTYGANGQCITTDSTTSGRTGGACGQYQQYNTTSNTCEPMTCDLPSAGGSTQGVLNSSGRCVPQ